MFTFEKKTAGSLLFYDDMFGIGFGSSRGTEPVRCQFLTKF